MGKWAACLAQSRWSLSWDIYLFGSAWSSLVIDAEVRQMMIWSWLAGAFDVRYERGCQMLVSASRGLEFRVRHLRRPLIELCKCAACIFHLKREIEHHPCTQILKFRSGHQVSECRSS